MQWVKNLTAAARVAGRAQVQSPAQDSGLKDLVLLQLWLVADVAWIQYLAGELPYAMGAAIKKKNLIMENSPINGRFQYTAASGLTPVSRGL